MLIGSPAISFSACADDLQVKFDQSQLLAIRRPAADVFVGNPSIADVAIHSRNLLVVTGRSFGVTNLIALDGNGDVIKEHRVFVQLDERKTVNVCKAGKRETYNCADRCSPSMTVGDDASYFEAIAKQSERKKKLADGAGMAEGINPEQQ